MTSNRTQNAPLPTMPATSGFRESYYNSTMELRHGSVVSEISLGHLRNEEVLELLRMRHLWPRH